VFLLLALLLLLVAATAAVDCHRISISSLLCSCSCSSNIIMRHVSGIRIRRHGRPARRSRNRLSRRRQPRDAEGTRIQEDAPFAIFLLMVELYAGMEGASA